MEEGMVLMGWRNRGEGGFWVRFVLLAFCLTVGCSRPKPWNVLVITLDTTRADHLGCYGNETIETPHIDALAQDGVRFAHAYSAVPITLPSHSTIFTGLYPLGHGVRDNGLFILSPEQITMAEWLQSHGYATAAAIGAFPLLAKFGIDQGFDFFDDHLTKELEGFSGKRVIPKTRLFFDERRAARVNEALFPWLEAHRDQRFFAWVHYFDAHQPHEPPPPYDALYANDLYDGEIAYADECVGTLMAYLKELGVYERTLIVLTGDHGEGLGEHNEETHSYLNYNTTLHVPLIVRLPEGIRGQVVPQRVGTVDIFPTVLDLLNLPIPADLHGRSLAAYFDPQTPPPAPRPQYAETLSPRLAQGWGELRTLFDEKWKYIFGPRPELFDLEVDPHERTCLVEAHPDIARRMRLDLEAMLETHARTEAITAVSLDAETREQLMALGYLQGGSIGAETIEERLRSDGQPPQDRIGDIQPVSAAKEMLFRGRALQAREIALHVLKDSPENRYFLEILAYSQAQLGLVEEALATIETMVQKGAGAESSSSLLLSLGIRLYLHGSPQEGLRRIRQSQELYPSGRGLYLLHHLLSEQGEDEERWQVLERAVEVDPQFAPARLAWAVHLAEIGRQDLAKQGFESLLADSPYFSKVHYNYGAFLLETGDYERAANHFRRTLELEPRHMPAYYALVAIHLGFERVDQAREVLAKMTQLAPEHPETLRARSLLEVQP